MVPTLLRISLDSQFILHFIGLLGLAWALFLFTHRRGNPQANRFLALLIVVLSSFVLRRTAEVDEGGITLFLYFISHGLIYLMGPAIYLHILFFTGKKPASKNIYPHFIAAFCVVILMSILFFHRSEIDKISDLSSLKTVSILFISLQVVHVLVYVFYSKKLVMDFSRKCETYYSSISKVNVAWMRRIVLISVILGFSILALHLMIVSGGYYEINNTVDGLFLLLLAFIIVNIIYKSWRQPEIVSGVFQDQEKYQNSPMSMEESKELVEKLEKKLQTDRAFLTAELNIEQLANSVGTKSYLLSQLLNEHYELNFFNFINSYRVEFAMNMIQQGSLEKLTLEAIAYKSGFNSKSTFNRAFKKKAGCTPKEYAKSLVSKT